MIAQMGIGSLFLRFQRASGIFCKISQMISKNNMIEIFPKDDSKKLLHLLKTYDKNIFSWMRYFYPDFRII